MSDVAVKIIAEDERLRAEVKRLQAEIKSLRAQYDVDPEPPKDEDNITGLCSVCGGASNQLRARGKWWVCPGCWQEDCDGE